jgi:RNA polymerase sigma-70 factor (ECF subfamily)
LAIPQRILGLPYRSDSRSDRSLVRAAQKGDKRAAGVLIERYYPRIYSFVSHMGANGHAEDFTQEVFARALSALPRFNGTYRVGPWLLRIAKNLCIDEARRETFRPPPVDPSELSELERDDQAKDNVWQSVSQNLAGTTVQHALSKLPARQRVTLVLREIERFSYADIAEVIGTNSRGAEATLRRARARFRMEVANAQGVEGQKAACQRVLRLVADNQTPTIEVARHLKTCQICRTKASAIRKADKLLAALPPLTIGRPWWKSELAAKLRPRVRPRGIMEILRRRGELGFLTPFGQVAEMVTTLTMASAVTVASVGGTVQRLVAVAPSPPAIEVAQAAPSQPGGGSGPIGLGVNRGGRSGPASSDGPAPAPSPGATPPTAVPTDAVDADVSMVREVMFATTQSGEQVVETVSNAVAGVVGGVEGATSPDPGDSNQELPIPIPQTNAALPSGPALPRRRRIPYWS